MYPSQTVDFVEISPPELLAFNSTHFGSGVQASVEGVGYVIGLSVLKSLLGTGGDVHPCGRLTFGIVLLGGMPAVGPEFVDGPVATEAPPFDSCA